METDLFEEIVAARIREAIKDHIGTISLEWT